MKSRRCYVLNCPTRENPEAHKLVSMFLVPTDEETFALWKSVVPDGYRELSKFSRVCEYHFGESCIVRTSQAKLVNGSIVEVPLKKPRLKAGAIPTIFDASLYSSNSLGVEKSAEDRAKSDASTIEQSPSKAKASQWYSGHICSVPTCVNALRRNAADAPVSFHKYPKDRILQNVWIKRCKPLRCNLSSIENRHVCSLHFEPKCLKTSHDQRKRMLLKNSAPTLNLPDDHHSVEVEMPTDETDPLAMEASTELAEEENFTKETASVEMSDDDVLVIDEDVDQESNGDSERPVEASLLSLALLDPVAQLKKRGRPPMITKKPTICSPADYNWSTDSNTSLNLSSEASIDISKDNEELKNFETIDFDPLTLEKFDLRDPLETACNPKIWNRLSKRARKKTMLAYFKRLAYLLPEYETNNTANILTSSLEYLKWVGKNNSSLALMNEVLSQKHYALRKKHERLSKILLKSNNKKQ